MTGNEKIRVQLAALLENGSLAKSACSSALLKFLKPLLDSGVVMEERLGAGRRLTVHDAPAVRCFFMDRFPDSAVSGETPNRTASVAQYRNSKTLSGDTPDILMLRAWSDAALWCNGIPVPLARATGEHGVFSFVVTLGNSYELRAACGLIENPTMLLAFERLGLTSTIPVALYAGGRVSSRLLSWLKNISDPCFHLLHFPDYDPVGLSDFVRVRNALGDRATLYLPANLDWAFSRFSNADLLRNESSQALLRNLRTSQVPEVRTVVGLIDRYNAGLEQEALFMRC